MNIVLTGFMGTGKTFAGKLIARRLNWDHYDTDEMIEKEVGMPISKIFELKGEEHFRKLETNTARLVSVLDKVVISTGGGIVLRKENIDELEKNGAIVCLTAAPEKIYERVKKETHRPLLKVPDPVSKINELLEFRKEAYGRCHLIVDTTDLGPEQVVDKILQFPMIAEGIK
jgi:shikimate kinase